MKNININIGDIYWMPSKKFVDKKSVDTKLVISKVGSKYIYANREDSNTEYTFTFESEGVLNLVNNMVHNKAYSEELWKKQKLIIELDTLTQKFNQDFLQVNSSTDFRKYQDYLDKMNNLSQRILEHD